MILLQAEINGLLGKRSFTEFKPLTHQKLPSFFTISDIVFLNATVKAIFDLLCMKDESLMTVLTIQLNIRNVV